MTPFEAYQMFLALKRHFDSKGYDYHKYGGKVKLNPANFELRKDKYLYYKLSKFKDPKTFIIANLIDRDVTWIGDLFDTKSETCYTEYCKRQQSITYKFKSDIAKLDDDLNANFTVVGGQYPLALRLYLKGEITIETLIILDGVFGIFTRWDKAIADPIIWPSIHHKCVKARSFMSYPIDKMKKELKYKYSA